MSTETRTTIEAKIRLLEAAAIRSGAAVTEANARLAEAEAAGDEESAKDARADRKLARLNFENQARALTNAKMVLHLMAVGG
jgi:hypothetical protein